MNVDTTSLTSANEEIKRIEIKLDDIISKVEQAKNKYDIYQEEYQKYIATNPTSTETITKINVNFSNIIQLATSIKNKSNNLAIFLTTATTALESNEQLIQNQLSLATLTMGQAFTLSDGTKFYATPSLGGNTGQFGGSYVKAGNTVSISQFSAYDKNGQLIKTFTLNSETSGKTPEEILRANGITTDGVTYSYHLATVGSDDFDEEGKLKTDTYNDIVNNSNRHLGFVKDDNLSGTTYNENDIKIIKSIGVIPNNTATDNNKNSVSENTISDTTSESDSILSDEGENSTNTYNTDSVNPNNTTTDNESQNLQEANNSTEINITNDATKDINDPLWANAFTSKDNLYASTFVPDNTYSTYVTGDENGRQIEYHIIELERGLFDNNTSEITLPQHVILEKNGNKYGVMQGNEFITDQLIEEYGKEFYDYVQKMLHKYNSSEQT
ncbi:MAG: hypothetical protein Q4G04_04075 [bacterium]|nr:hypothetical protein [bacterium]